MVTSVRNSIKIYLLDISVIYPYQPPTIILAIHDLYIIDISYEKLQNILIIQATLTPEYS